MKHTFQLNLFNMVLLLLVVFNEGLLANDKNVLLYLPFDGDCNSSVPHKEGNIRGSASFDAGKVGKALIIGGKENNLVEFIGETYLNPKQGTIAFWIKPIDWGSSKVPDSQGFYFFYLKDHAFLYRVWKDKVSFYCKFPAANVYHLYNADFPLRQGQWAHVALSWLDNVLKIYANGELAGKFMLREPMRRDWQGKGIRIGESWSKNHTLIDEFYVFDYPLPASEIKKIYETSLEGKPAQLPDFKPLRVHVTHYSAVSKAFICVDAKHASFGNSPVAADLFLIDSRRQSTPLGTMDKFATANQTVEKLLDLPKNLAAGQYAITARLVDASGRELATAQSAPFEKRVYPWEQVNTGLSDEVIPPFTPLKMKNNVISCWGREYVFKGDGFPEKILTRKAQILSNPITLEATINRSSIRLGDKINVITQKPGVIIFTNGSQNNIAKLEVTCSVEYDGMMLYNIKLIPQREISLDKILIKIPVKNVNAKLYHVCRDVIRQNSESGYLPKGQGKIWGSSAKKSKNVLGTFIPYFWVGDYDRGFCWMADSDKNWSVSDGEDCVEFFRNGRTLTAIVNLISYPKVIAQPWETSFAFMAGPPRPEPVGWRAGPLNKNLNNTWSAWFSGRAETLQGYGKPPNFPKYLEDVKDRKKVLGYYGVNTSPNDFWGVTEENKYFQLEWCGGTTDGYPLIHRNNFVMYTLDQLMKKGYIDGLYSDDVFPVATTNLVTGTGYIRDDGKIQAGYSMFALRDFFKRSAFLFREHHCSRSMMVHMTDSMIMPCYSFWDIKNDNEWSKNKPGVTDHIDAWSLGEICARTMSRQYGMAAVWHTPADWKNSPESGGDDLACLLLLHDILGRTEKIKERTAQGKSRFGIGEPDVEFLGYWVLQPDTDPEKKDVKFSAWVRKKFGTALVVVANLSKQDWEGTINLPLHFMGLSPHAVAYDAEGNQGAGINFDNGAITLAVPRHNYRFLLLGPKGYFPEVAPLGAKLNKPLTKEGASLEKPKMKTVPDPVVKVGPPHILNRDSGGK